eukprot:CAMPEP_0196994784 /NCGR_PEP_ID=MMETSP1380-20130617/1022_1 /TAXON_ID=5936 /ORGANISM="Euplotes crassus, Strain CT5" /LENGTH=142 /DNA_ID=CAMNT_0042410249 /DNA_START=98 /DNA_END=526 /DNA_ORIENTATION=-
MVTSLAYGASVAYHSQNQKHQEQVLQIDGAIDSWESQYRDETKAWKPVLINNANEEVQFSELNTPDFHSQFSDLHNYTVVKYNIDNIVDVLRDSTETKKENPNNGEFNLTSTLLVNFNDGNTLSLEDIPVYVRKKSSRSSKD